jgi:hypothetical protein
MEPAAQRPRVYPWSTAGVKPQRATLCLFASAPALTLLIWLALPTSGCTSVRSGADAAYLIAVGYDVEPVFVEKGRREAVETVRRDFQDIAEVGFTGVLLRHVDDADRGAVLDIAEENGLRAAVPQRSFDHYLLTGMLPPGCGSKTDLVLAASSRIAHHPSFAAFVVNCARSRSAGRRGAGLCRLLEQHGVPGVTVDSRNGDPTAVALARIDPGATEGDRGSSLVETWLAQFHAGLASGRTAGLVFDRYRRPPGDPRGLVASRGAPGPTDRAAIKHILTRAQQWGPTLYRAVPAPTANTTSDVDDLSAAALVRGKRRFVLVLNRSMERYARGNVLLPESIGGKAVTRAVEVPPSPADAAGRVIEPQRGRITLSAALRPGDAALFEIF